MSFSPRQQEIIDTAMKIITEEGMENLTTKNMAAQVGVTEAALYRHFASKTDILLGVLEYFEQRVKNQIAAAEKSGMQGMDRFYRILSERAADFMERPALVAVILSEEVFPNEPLLGVKLNGTMKINRSAFIGAISEAQTLRTIRTDVDSEQVFRMVIGTFRLLVTQWRLSGRAFNLVNEFDAAWKGILTVLKP